MLLCVSTTGSLVDTDTLHTSLIWSTQAQSSFLTWRSTSQRDILIPESEICSTSRIQASPSFTCLVKLIFTFFV